MWPFSTHLLPERFLGVWTLERSENYDEYLAVKGLLLMLDGENTLSFRFHLATAQNCSLLFLDEDFQYGNESLRTPRGHALQIGAEVRRQRMHVALQYGRGIRRHCT